MESNTNIIKELNAINKSSVVLDPIQSTSPIVPTSITLCEEILERIIEYVGQYDLPRLCLTCKLISAISMRRLYKSITVNLNPTVPTKYNGDVYDFVRDNSLKYSNTVLIVTLSQLLRLVDTLERNPSLISSFIRHFGFGKCYGYESIAQPFMDTTTNSQYTKRDMICLQWKLYDLFSRFATNNIELDISYISSGEGYEKLHDFVTKKESVRNTLKDLYVNGDPKHLYSPFVPPKLQSLYLKLDEDVLLEEEFQLDTSTPSYNILYNLNRLQCSTDNYQGLELLRKIKLTNEEKLQPRQFALYHCHEDADHDHTLNTMLKFPIFESKLDLLNITDMSLFIACQGVSTSSCSCFGDFYHEFTRFSNQNQGMPHLKRFEMGGFLGKDWLRPHQFLSDVLVPLGSFLQTLVNLEHLVINHEILGFKMFGKSSGITCESLNKLSEQLMELFFLNYFVRSNNRIKTLQLTDFLTSFIYYHPLFYQSLLHTCKCWGCEKVLGIVGDLFFPIPERPTEVQKESLETSYFITFGYILGKLMADRSVFVPKVDIPVEYRNYGLYKGHPNMLHNQLHEKNEEEEEGDEDEDDNDDTATADVTTNADDELDFGIDPNAFRSSPPSNICQCANFNYDIDDILTTYLIHQLRPITSFLQKIFVHLETLMIHGIYFEYINTESRFVPIYDEEDYPEEFEQDGMHKSWQEYQKPFGEFKPR
ncbi:uncharacterized protein KQ657_004917 [Scheffersomyces spartinae]|uniref:F-box domain-containing protein n=1 Tax=Scheffersomyces spartinae TaxID=45513 RepID=A0A9P8AIZ4_9ASCO|nr:uncharacterized protein KQ657_004917 [Scheffersomyces spartinae]KAG7194205.1 hypothetical protein KQ657_004917 [Scheffersomyces spartinae]